MIRSLACLGLLLVGGCSQTSTESNDVVVLDLVAQLDESEVFTETGRLDIGTPQARSFLTLDWSWNEKDGAGTTFVWGGPGSSEVAFFVAAPRPLTVKFRSLPYRESDGLVTAMSVSVNDTALGPMDLQPDWNEYELELPADGLLGGINRLKFEYVWSTEEQLPEEGRPGRRVAVAWDWIEFTGIDAGLPAAVSGEGLLRLTPGSRVDFYFEAPADAELVTESILQTGEGGGTLEISTLQDGTSPQRILGFDGLYQGRPLDGRRRRHRSLPLKEVPNRWPLASSGGLVRLRLESSGVFELSKPMVVSRTTPVDTNEPSTTSRLSSSMRSEPPLILLYVIDTLRADYLDNSQTTHERSPGLAALMQDGVVFEETLAQSSWTKPTVASILTGQPPWTHGAQNANDVLAADLDSLPVHMQRNGYRTAAFSANGYVSTVFGFDRGFDHFALTSEFDAPSSQVHAEALRWLDDQAEQEVFLFVQTIDPHSPYAPVEPFRSQYAAEIADDVGSIEFMRELARERRQPELAEIEDVRRLYSAEIAFFDQQFSELMAALESRNLYDPALIVVVSDHGEEFYEHSSWTHGRTLHREVLQVPMVVKFPHGWGAGFRVAHPVQQIDLLPTLMDFLDFDRASILPGQSLLCAIEEAMAGIPLACETSRPRPLFSTLHYHQNHWVGVVYDGWKLILPATQRLSGQAELYDRRIDRAELDNVAEHFPVRVGYLASLIRLEMRSRSIPVAPEQVELDPETEARLRALGYLN